MLCDLAWVAEPVRFLVLTPLVTVVFFEYFRVTLSRHCLDVYSRLSSSKPHDVVIRLLAHTRAVRDGRHQAAGARV